MPVANLKSQLAAAMRLFRVPADNPDLTRAQFDAFSKQIPLLYFILMSNTIAVAYTYVNVAPDWLTLIVPSVLTVLAALRTFWWLRQRHIGISYGDRIGDQDEIEQRDLLGEGIELRARQVRVG